MMAPVLGTLRNDSNVSVYNYVRGQMSPQYAARIPHATQANIQHTLENLFDLANRQVFNEFTQTLVNRIGTTLFRNRTWTNSMAAFKQGPLNFGSTIQEIMTGLLTAHSYRHETGADPKMLLGVEQPLTLPAYQTVNREDVYRLTVDEQTLRRAFMEPTGLASFVSNLVASQMTSANFDEFLLMVRLFSEYERLGGYFRVTTPDLSGPITADTRSQAQDLLVSCREWASTLRTIAPHYNAAKMPVYATPDELVLFCTPRVKAIMDVTALAAAFNLDLAQPLMRIIEIPAEHFPQAGVQAILTTRDFFVVADQVLETQSFPNPATLRTNYFLHVRQVLSVSPFAPAIMFWTGEGDSVNVNDPGVTAMATPIVSDDTGTTVTTVERGFYYRVTTDVTTAMPTSGMNTAVRYIISGNTSLATKVSATGALFVAPGEEGTTLTITAIPVWWDPENPTEIPVTPTSVSVTVADNPDPVPTWPIDVPTVPDGTPDPDPEPPTPTSALV